jgi:short subunit dehydrogenase-like uncharacterized protein
VTEHERTYDVVVFGATGFTGRLVARYLAAVAPPPRLRWAIAGRNRAKLETLRTELLAVHKDCGDVGLLIADVADPPSLVEVARQTRVVLSTVGPFARYGEPVVRACVEEGAHYVDITGEPAFVDMTLERYDDMARERGVRVVSCCGFDSIPHDLGVMFTVGKLPRDVPLRVEGFVQARGSFSGGTWTSAVEAFGGAREYAARRAASSGGGYGDDGDPRRVRGIRPRVRYEGAVKGWVAPFPTIDPQVVLRSARLLDGYGPDFRYGHYVRVGTLSKLAVGAVAIGGVVALSQLEPTRELLLKVRQSGEGPNEAERARSWFRVTFLGEGGGRRVVTRVSGGDPGYDETAKMVAQSAMCLAEDGDRLPDRAGVLTPATAMGEPLLERLQREGITFEVLEEGSAH